MGKVPLTLQDMPSIKDYLRRFPPTFSEMSFANLFAYLPFRPLDWIIYNETLLFILSKENLLFGEPIGSLSSDEAIEALQLKGGRRTTAPKGKAFSAKSLPHHADYIYLTRDIATLEGHAYHRKRQLIQGCIDRLQPSLLPLEERHIEGCLLLNDQLGKNEESAAVATLLHHFEPFHLFGSVVVLEGVIKAFIVAEPLSLETVNIHAAKGDHRIHGLYPFLFHTFAKNIQSVYAYMNMQQDLGILGLQTAKERWHPSSMTIKYDLKRRTT